MQLKKLKKNQLKRQFALDNGTENKEIIVVPHKMDPYSSWAPKFGVQVTKTEGELYITDIEDDRDIPFDDYVNAYAVHNCNNELGYYLAYYLKEGNL